MKDILKPISNPLELRLDNLVYNKHSEVHRFGVNDFYAYKHPSMGGNYGFYSIPLTIGWLINELGFETDHICFFKDDFTIGHFANGDFIWLPTGRLSSPNKGVVLKSVHQLQNLYQSIKEKELGISRV